MIHVHNTWTTDSYIQKVPTVGSKLFLSPTNEFRWQRMCCFQIPIHKVSIQLSPLQQVGTYASEQMYVSFQLREPGTPISSSNGAVRCVICLMLEQRHFNIIFHSLKRKCKTISLFGKPVQTLAPDDEIQTDQNQHRSDDASQVKRVI
ncbi:hypothetical protein Mapa_012552 [Marchantia paleacea]|nr:hypothetical protein Mapa_012552 [Marchantia paleacea]